MRYFWTTYWANIALTPIYLLFVMWSIWRWARSPGDERGGWRFHAATFGLFLGVGSAILLVAFYAHLWVTGNLIAHGAILWLLFYAGESSADAGLLLALAGRGVLRASAVLVNLVMVFQWWGRMIVGLHAEAVLSTIMYVCVAIACAWFCASLTSKPQFRRETDPV